MPRWLSRSIGVSRIRQIDRIDRDHLHGLPRRGSRNHDHRGHAAEARKGKPLDHLLVGDDLVGAGRQLAVDAPDAERMLEMDRFASRARGHGRASLRTDRSDVWDMGETVRAFPAISYHFLAG